MVPVFPPPTNQHQPANPQGNSSAVRKLMPKRNYMAIVVYDPEVVSGTFGTTTMSRPSGRLSLAADFLVQDDGAYNQVLKHGPVIIPNLEFGR